MRSIHAFPVLETEVGEKDEQSHGDVFCRYILSWMKCARLIGLDNQRLDYPRDQDAFLNGLLTLKDKPEKEFDKTRIG